MPLSKEYLDKFKSLMAEPVPTPSNSTKTKKEIKLEFEKRFGAITPTADIVAKIEAAERVVWIPSAYCLFVRQSTCLNCRATERVLDFPRLFLQSRKPGRDPSHAYMYTPVKGIEFVTLPRRTILNVATIPFCLSCFEGALCQENSSNSSQADTASPIEELEKLPPELLLARLNAAASRFSSTSSFHATSNQEESAGSPSETAFGSGCGEREFEQLATAEG